MKHTIDFPPARRGCASTLPGARAQTGIILIAALAVLLMLTLLSVGMFRSFGLEERITGNSREKQHAFYAAQSALQNAEYWLLGGNAGTPVTCSLTAPSNTPVVCDPTQLPSNFQQTLATTAWNCSFGTTFIPLSQGANGTAQATASTSCNGTTTTGTYYADPQYFITRIGPDPSGTGTLYQITALGFGGNANSQAVVQSVFSVGTTTTTVSR